MKALFAVLLAVSIAFPIYSFTENIRDFAHNSKRSVNPLLRG